MTGLGEPKTLHPCPDTWLSEVVSVMWLDASGCWLVTLTKSYVDHDGELVNTVPWSKRYGTSEASTGYQALCLGLSDYRTRG